MQRSGPLFASSVLLVLTAGAAAGQENAAPEALVLREGATARQALVGIARDVVVEGEALSDVAALDGDVRVRGTVSGDVIVLGGDAVVEGSGRVDGDVFALGGRVIAEPGARIGGRGVSHPTASGAWMALLEGPAVGTSPWDPLVLGAKLALVTAWLALTLALLAVSGREVVATAQSVREEPFRNFFLGLTATLALLLAALLFAAFTAGLVGVPLVVLVVLFALLLKLWGMVGVFTALGDWLAGRVRASSGRRRAAGTALTAAVVGLAVLGAVKLLPWVGALVWTIATLIGVGAALDTKFGRREPWFETTG